MRELLLNPSDVYPATIKRNELILDRSKPLDEQLEDLEEDLLHAIFPNGLVLDVGWCPGWKAHGQFNIALVTTGWEDVVKEQQCRTINELLSTIHEFVDIARSMPGNGAVRRPQ